MNTIKLRKYKQYNENEILGLYKSVGWVNYTNNPEMLRNAFSNSLTIVGAYEDERLIDIIRVVGDGYSIIYIQDIIVLPEYQRMGIGSQILKEILSLYSNVYQKTLLTENQPNTVAFYKKRTLFLILKWAMWHLDTLRSVNERVSLNKNII